MRGRLSPPVANNYTASIHRAHTDTAKVVRMLSTMQDIPLSLTRILEYGSSVHGQTQVVTWHSANPGNEREETTFADIGARAAAFARWYGTH